MNGAHVSGAGAATLLATVAVGLLHRYTSVKLSDSDATVLGGTALAAGVGIGHGLAKYGLRGVAKLLWAGVPHAKQAAGKQ